MDNSMRTLPEEMAPRELAEYFLKTLATNCKIGSIGISELGWLYRFVMAAQRARLPWTATAFRNVWLGMRG